MKYILSFLLLFLISCNQNRFEKIIVLNKNNYWDIFKDGTKIFSNPSYCYCFGSNGSCHYYNYRINNIHPVRQLFDYGDADYPNTWKVKSDTLEIQSFNYLIKHIVTDTIILVPINRFSDTLILTKSKIIVP